MNLNTPNFLFLFLPLFILVYSLCNKRIKLVVGIAGSLLFYSWGNSRYLLLMIGLTLFAYLIARGIDYWRAQNISLLVFWMGVLLVLSVLVFFKLRTDISYPLGLSYVTFQVIAYFVEAYKKEEECERDILKFSFYLLLFPKIPVGPIVRYGQVKAQIANLHVEPQDMADGLRRFLVGFAKKALIADTLATVVTPVFDLQSPVIPPSIAWLVIISYSLQLYFDFSGYTDMALGVARMMGITFMENFNFPYLSRSISDFWRRWHISLSNWFRDIVFYPLERRRLKWFGQQINILIVFILTGLWHGITRNFLIWGLIHGLALVFESTFLGRKLRNLWIPLQHLYALVVILTGWVFFRSPTPDFALDFLRRLAGDTRGIQILPFELTSPLPFIEPSFLLALTFGLIMCLPLNIWFQKVFPGMYEGHELKYLPLQVIYDAGLIMLFLFALAAATSATYQPGIYGTF
jgi:alginate O-acetyltransferase complex protein AlgI